ncbi:MAG: biotin/lipoate A/B protein ligase family protein [Candidatus Nanohaloarchaea archaeon]|nr:biotin/lipoate A/B protein ligase family protein [Candidatus Nanohaloarchaea archaeon]
MNVRIIKDDEPRSEAMHHALDETLTERLDQGDIQPTLRFWYRENEAIPIGRFQSFEDEVQEEYVADNGIDVVRRVTGGGAMFVQPGSVVTYSMYLPADRVADDIEQSYADLDAWAVDALQSVGLDVSHEPLNDIVHPDGKIGGAAQLRKGSGVLHHATLSYSLDTEEMLRCLRIGKDKISDKAIQSAEKRVAVMRDYVDLDRSEIIDAMVATFRDRYGGEDGAFTDDELSTAERLAAEKFSSDSWNRMM